MIKKFAKNNQGSVVAWVLVITIAVLIGGKFFAWLKLSSDSTNEKAVTDAEYVMELRNDRTPTAATNGWSNQAISDVSQQIDDVMISPKIEASPEATEYFYSYNDTVRLKATAVSGNAYIPKAPYSCKWEGISGYTGNACEIPQDIKLAVGQNTIKVTLCDSRKACADSEKRIYLGYKDPLLVMSEEWDNYKIGNSEDGLWKYDSSTNTIFSTQNVGWTGYTNPSDKDLTDYELSFKMAVTRSGDDDSIGFTFRQKDTNNFYFLSVDNRTTNSGAIHSGLYKRVNGTNVLLVDLMPLKWDVNRWMDVKISAVGSNIQVWIDGVRKVNINDSTFSKGSYGPFSYSQAYATYQDLKITFPNQ